MAAPGALTTADFDGDGMLDVAVASVDQPQLALLMGKGDGTFAAGADARIGVGGGDIAVADMDQDGHPDIVISNTLSGSLSVALGNGAGGIVKVVSSRAGTNPGRLVIADVDGDGTLDAVVAVSGGIAVLRGKGDGTLVPLSQLTIGATPADMLGLDVNADGILDLVVALPTQNLVRVYLGDRHGGFAAGATLDGDQPVAITHGDFTGDGLQDLVVANAGDQTLTLFIGHLGGFDPPCTVATAVVASRLARADLNGDGRADVVALDAMTGAVSVLLGAGGRSCGAAAFAIGTDLTIAAAASGMAVADINGDRLPDLVIGVPSAHMLALAVNTTNVEVRPGDLNRDTRVDRADLQQLLAELFDGDGSDADSCAGGAVVSGAEADVNGDRSITGADVSALIRRLTP